MIEWNQYHDQAHKGIAEIGRANLDIVRGYCKLGHAIYVILAKSVKSE